MQKKCTKKLLSWILCTVLIVAMALCTAGCNGRTENGDAAADGQGADVRVESTEPGDNSESEDASEAGNDSESGENAGKSGENAGSTEDGAQSEASVLGEGSTEFALTVVDKDGNETLFEIHTDKETVGEALLELELISGDEGEYGLYVKTVNGITADYDTDGVYWAFYINGEYAMTGVDATPITEGDSYSFKVE